MRMSRSATKSQNSRRAVVSSLLRRSRHRCTTCGATRLLSGPSERVVQRYGAKRSGGIRLTRLMATRSAPPISSASTTCKTPVGPAGRFIPQILAIRCRQRIARICGMNRPAGPTGVLHVVDALLIGGAERVAINLVNLMPPERFAPYLCTTRSEGPLSSLVAPHVVHLCLERRSKLDTTALREFCDFVADRDIRIVHAHASALFFGRLASALSRRCALIWHDHYGRADFSDRPVWLYRAATRGVAGVITVNEKLRGWCCERLRIPEDRVWYIPNLVPSDDDTAEQCDSLALAGEPGKRLVCVANFRPQKD